MMDHIISIGLILAGIFNILMTIKYTSEMKKWFGILKAVYATILRPLVVEKVEDSTSEVDDFILNLIDKLFDYEV